MIDKLDEIKKKLKERFDEEFYKKCVTTEEVARKTVFNIIEECFKIKEEYHKIAEARIKDYMEQTKLCEAEGVAK